MRVSSTLILCLAFFALTHAASAQGFNLLSGRNHPELTWLVAETEHFRIMYPARLAGIEIEAAAIAEEAYAVLSQNFGVRFDAKIPIYLSDEDEIANGFAAPFAGGYTMIWVHASDGARLKTGRTKWLRSVIAHELAHLFHFEKVLARPRWLSFVAANPLPRFWTEGIAQYQTESWNALRGDRWLRTAVLDDQLSYRDGRSLWNGRLLYAIGHAQLRYLAERYGDSTLVEVLAHRRPVLFGLARVHDFETAFRAVTNRSYRSFFDEWRRHVNVYYNTMAGQLENPDSLAAAPLRLPGQYHFDVRYSRDTTFAAVHALESMRRPVQRLYVVDREARTTSTVAEGSLLPPFSWSPDGRRLAYARLRRGEYGSILRDLYVVERDGSNRRRLTDSRRAGSPSFSPDGSRLAFTATTDGTDNVFVLDLETGAETAATRFTGDHQIPSVQWHPREDEILVARFTEDGRREIAVVTLADGASTAITDGLYDDRDPVWSPDGRQVAYTSLRDDVPNVFVYDRATHSHERVTRLTTGAAVRDWLPPDSAHPAGTLVVTSHTTKTGDTSYRIDAARRVADPVVGVPAPYVAWTGQTPPETIPISVEPDATLVTRRYAYRSTRNVRHVMSFALPYYRSANDWGIGGLTAWTEPLGKHILLLGGAVSVPDPLGESFLLGSYVNNQWFPTIGLNLYRLPGTLRIYGNDLLVEALTGGDAMLRWPLDWSDRPYVSESFEARLRVVDVEPLRVHRIGDVATLPPAEAGQQADLRLGYSWRRQRPYWDNVVHPLDGLGIQARLLGAAPVLGTDRRFLRSDVSAFGILRGPGLHRVYLYGRSQVQFGESFAQDFVGLSRYDDVRIHLPAPIPLALGETERVRGYRSYALGNRLLFGTLEYRAPIVTDLRTTLLGVVSLGSLAAAVFADGALVWSDGAIGEGVSRAGVGIEVKNALRIGGLFTLAHALGAAQPAEVLGSRTTVEVYYRVRTTVPF